MISRFLNLVLVAGRDVFTGKTMRLSVVEAGNPKYRSLPVMSGARPSQLPGRVPVHKRISGVTADTLIHTVTPGTKFYLTDINVFVSNTSLLSVGRFEIKDGTNAAGSTVVPVSLDPATNQANASVSLSHSYKEEVPFLVGVFADILAGTLVLSIGIDGYEETI